MIDRALGQDNPLFGGSSNFDAVLERYGLRPLRRDRSPQTLQVNLGKLCNQSCHHCHVDAGPKRTEIMNRATAQRVLELLINSPSVSELDITGGAPELNPNFNWLVEEARAREYSVIVRCNLTVLFEIGMEWLADFYRDYRVHLICSLPCYGRDNVEQQRGAGVFSKSILALQRLNHLGYGSELKLDLVYNPIGPSLPPAQEPLEARYREELGRNFGIVFDRLLTITNMPINRFARQLQRWGKFSEYMGLLVNHFNPATVEALMCRGLVSVSWDGRLFDCDFNQMREMPIFEESSHAPLSIWHIDDLRALSEASIATGFHCFGCTAGAGSSCGGALA
ncbi:MAG: arsenosugar biosynthesis radical SAM protein ArsS [Deltaproteobacteria bacterium]|nr:arsenosugar biosynthesis radical SAM protein ArsS [Deltaproteobacteria bacterium]